MGSHVLPQALSTIPRSSAQCELKRLAFPASLSSRPFSFTNSRTSISRVSLNSLCLGLSLAKLENRSFVVKAEGNAEGEPESVETDEAAQDETGTESEVEEAAAEKQSRKPRIKLGEIMGILNQRAIEASDLERPIPDIRVGDIVEIKLQVPNNRRLTVHKGIVMSKQNAGIHSTIRIRKLAAGIGVEIVFPLYSPRVREIRVVSHRKVRRAKLYYLRDKLPRFYTFK